MDHSEYVSLTDQEVDDAIRHGMQMRKTSLRRGHRNHVGYNPDDKKAMRVQALGAVCEAAVAKALGQKIDLKSEIFRAADLPGNVEVRLIGMEHYGLRVYPKDDDSRFVVGVVVPPGKERVMPYRLAGWIVAKDAKRPEWQMAPNNRPPMFAVPQSELEKVSILRERLSA